MTVRISPLRAAAGGALLGPLLALGLAFATTPVHAGGGCFSEPVTDASGVSAQIKDMCMVPTIIRIQPGQSVTWTNMDQMEHTVTGANDSWGSFDSLLPGHSATYRFSAAGTYPYFCVIHPGMGGAVVVGDGRSATSTVQAPPSAVPPQATPPVVVATPAIAPKAGDTRQAGPWPALAGGLALLGGVAGYGAARVTRK